MSAVAERGRLVLRCEEEIAPLLSVECKGDDFEGDLLGGRWVKMRSFAPVKGKVAGSMGCKWMAILQFRSGRPTFNWTGALDVPHLGPGPHKLEVTAVCVGPWVERVKGRLIIRDL